MGLGKVEYRFTFSSFWLVYTILFPEPSKGGEIEKEKRAMDAERGRTWEKDKDGSDWL